MLPEFKTILYPTDLNPSGGKALRHAASLARRYDARIVLLHALEPMTPYAERLVRDAMPAGGLERIRADGIAEIRQEAHERVERFYQDELLQERHGEIEIRIVMGPTARVILEAADDTGADLIVMGSHGHTVVGEIVLGSVANKVVHRARIPVLLVPYR